MSSEIIETENLTTIITESEPIITVIESIEVGPQGPKGLQGQTGTQGETGPLAGIEDISFSWGDAPTLIYTAFANKMIYSVEVIIAEGFNIANSIIEIGDEENHSRLFSSDIIDLTIVGTNKVFPNYIYTEETGIYIYATPGEGNIQGTGRLVIEHQN